MNNPTVAFVAGRSGGHIIPALTLAQKAKTEHPHTQVLFFTTAHTTDSTIVSQNPGIIDKHIPLSLDAVPFLNPLKIALFMVQFITVFFKSCSYLRSYRPIKVVGMGGYICLPVCWAAYLLNIPIELYDLDAQPGKATQALKYHAQRVYICFEEARAYLPASKTELVDYPIRFNACDALLSQHAALTHLKLSPTKKTLFIHGGSQGSLFINERMREWLSFNEHVHSLIQIIHQVGAKDMFDWVEYYKDLGINAVVFTFRADLAACYQAADLIIARAGAGSLFEALYFKKSCIIIPLETATTSHQKSNAFAFASKYPSLFTVIAQQDIKNDNMILFSAINKHIHAASKTIASQVVSNP